jgi:hypothetical protein
VHSRSEAHREDGVTTAAEKNVKILSLQRIEHGYGREMIDYRLGSDGVVRRWDGSDITAKRQRQKELGVEPQMAKPGMTPEESLKIAEVALEKLVNIDIPNARFEQAMGYQLQPIGLAELDGLTDFVTQPGVEVQR